MLIRVGRIRLKLIFSDEKLYASLGNVNFFYLWRLSWSLEIFRFIKIIKSDTNWIFRIPFKVFAHIFELYIVWKIIPGNVHLVTCSRWTKSFLDKCFRFFLSQSSFSEISTKECFAINVYTEIPSLLLSVIGGRMAPTRPIQIYIFPNVSVLRFKWPAMQKAVIQMCYFFYKQLNFFC